MSGPPEEGKTRKRRKAFLRGKSAEFAAAVWLTCKGYRILSRRYKTHVGEIDLVAQRGRRIAFVEVKQRPTRAGCEASVTGETRRRVRRAADDWLARHGQHRDCEMTFDLVFVLPWRLPMHLPGAL